MAIKLKEKKTTINSEKSSSNNSIEFLFFLALNILVIPFSAYQTFVGYEKDVAGNMILAIIVAAISAVLFAAMNFGIRQDRIQGKKHSLKILMYIIPFGLSFFGNFNAFYSNQMRENLLRSEVNKYKFDLTQTRDFAIQKINDSIDLNGFESEYNEAKPPNWGPKSQQKWEELVRFLKSKGGEINISDQGKNKIVFFDNARTFSKNTYDELVDSKKRIVEGPLDDINSKYNPIIKQIDSLTSLSKPIYNSSMLNKMVEVENDIRAKTESFFGGKEIFEYPALVPSEENEIGTIKHTINSAFVKFENPSATVFSFFLSIIIDVAALIYILVFIPYHRKSKKGGRINSGPQRI